MKHTFLLAFLIFGLLLASGCVDQTKLELEQSKEQIRELQQQIESIEEFNKYYSKGLTEYNFAIFDSYGARYNYELWGFYYEQGHIDADSIYYCIAARDLYITSNNAYQKAIIYFEEADNAAKENYKELIGYYINASNMAIDMNWAMYEACEYYESACNYFIKGMKENGNAEIDRGNEKLSEHDSLVKEYSTYISKIEVLEETFK